MTLKRKGEVELEEIYAGAPKGVSYTVLRPGGLTDGPVVGPKGETVPDAHGTAGSRADSRADESKFSCFGVFHSFFGLFGRL